MKKICTTALSFLVVLSLCTVSFAGNKQLKLDTSSIADGATDVSLTPEINLLFTNNVINMSVKDGNMAAINMVSSDGENIEIVVEMADDQINPEEKRKVTVKTSESLENGKAYKLVIDKSFSGKNGSKIGENIEINFTTVGGKSSSSGTTAAMVGAVVVAVGFLGASRKKRKNG